MPIMTQEHLEARRIQILRAAVKCFAQKGFKRTTIRDICRVAGLSSGAVYNYFSGKDEIVEIITRLSIEENRDRIKAAAANKSPLSSAAQSFISMAKDPGYIQIIGFNFELFAESRINPKIAKSLLDIVNDSVRQLAQVVKSGQAGGAINSDLDPSAVAQVLWAQIMGLHVLAFLDRKLDIDRSGSVVEAILEGRFPAKKKKGKGGRQ